MLESFFATRLPRRFLKVYGGGFRITSAPGNLEINQPVKSRVHLALLAGILPLQADWRDDVGYTRLKLLASSDLPSVPSQGFTQVEASTTASPVFTFLPETTNTLFTGKTFTNKSAATGTAVSFHATHVATNFFGNTTSLVTGNCPIDVYYVDDWLDSTFLNLGSINMPATESRAVENHSWVGSTGITNYDTEILRRLDYAINRDGFVCVVGSDNEGSTTLPELLSQSFNTISVGRDDGGHSAGFTNLDGTGRIKPDIVAPSANPEYATSWTTPMVSSAAGLLYAKLTAAPYSLTGADRPRVIKSLLLASATKNAIWANTSTRPLDLRYGAGILNINNAYNALRSGRATASNTVATNPRGWAAETISASSTKAYYFTVAAGAPSTPFSAALTWHRIATKSGLNTWNSTLANLNLHLYHASGFTLGSLISESLSTVDNVELIYQSALAPGTYALVVQNTSATSPPYALAWHSLPAVTIDTTTAIARETNGQAGIITVTRTGDTTLPLLVPLTVSGTAIAGTRYQALPSNITIAAGQSSATVTVTPISDNVSQGDQTVMVGIAADSSLVRDAAQTATITIQDKPTVSIAATASVARESDGEVGTITITRTGETTLPLWVPVAVSGSAVAGVHYQALPTSVTIAAGQTAATLSVTPISDDIAQGDRTVVIGIAADTSLVRDAAQMATVTIQDKAFDFWRFTNFSATELNNDFISGANADPDSDQLNNLIEYGLGLNPKVSGMSTVQSSVYGDYLSLLVNKNTAATDLSWAAEVTSDLQTWQDAVIIANTPTLLQTRDSVSTGSAEKRFIRLKLTRH